MRHAKPRTARQLTAPVTASWTASPAGASRSQPITATLTPPPEEPAMSPAAAGHHHERGERTPRWAASTSHGSVAYASSVIDVRLAKTTTYGLSSVSEPGGDPRRRARVVDHRVDQSHDAPRRDGEHRAEPEALDEPGGEPRDVAEREERPHREQVAAVLAAVDVAEVGGRRPQRGRVGEEADRVDVQVDLRLGRRPARALDEREEEGERREQQGVAAGCGPGEQAGHGT